VKERRHLTSKPVPDGKDHRGWIEYWLKEVRYAIDSHVETGSIVALEHAERSARMLHWHGVKARPALRDLGGARLVVAAVRFVAV
jgi:hypothetical protein